MKHTQPNDYPGLRGYKPPPWEFPTRSIVAAVLIPVYLAAFYLPYYLLDVESMGLSTWPNLIVGIGWLAGLASPFIVFGRFSPFCPL